MLLHPWAKCNAGIMDGCGWTFHEKMEYPKSSSFVYYVQIARQFKCWKNPITEFGRANWTCGISSGPENVWHTWRGFERPHHRQGTTYRQDGMFDRIKLFWNEHYQGNWPANLSPGCFSYSRCDLSMSFTSWSLVFYSGGCATCPMIIFLHLFSTFSASHTFLSTVSTRANVV